MKVEDPNINGTPVNLFVNEILDVTSPSKLVLKLYIIFFLCLTPNVYFRFYQQVKLVWQILLKLFPLEVFASI